jgi:hypothetical protein
MKRCFKCLCEKPFEAFYKHSRMGDGRLNKCIECTKRDVTNYRNENIEKVRAHDKLRASMPHRVSARREYSKTEAYATSHKKATRKWVAMHPNQRAANIAVNNALKRGDITKQPCFVCGDSRVEGHHPDYDKPLDVVWLCHAHHEEVHHKTI